MALHILADARQRMHDRHAYISKMIRVADTRQLQDMRGADRAGREDHLAACIGPLNRSAGTAARELDADRTAAVKYDAMDQSMGHQLQVRTLQRRVQIG